MKKKYLIAGLFLLFINVYAFSITNVFGYHGSFGMDCGTKMYRDDYDMGYSGQNKYNLPSPFSYISFNYGYNYYLGILNCFGIKTDFDVTGEIIHFSGMDAVSKKYEEFLVIPLTFSGDFMPWLNLKMGSIGFGAGAGYGLAYSLCSDKNINFNYLNNFSSGDSNFFSFFAVDAEVSFYYYKSTSLYAFVIRGRYQKNLSPMMIISDDYSTYWNLNPAKMIFYIGIDHYF